MERETIIAEARSWLETPWRHQGRTKRGIDCAGLIIRTGNDLKLLNYDVKAYPRHTSRDAFIRHFQANMKEKHVSQRKPGDVLLFKDGIYACHCGIIATKEGRETVIHAYINRGKTVEEPLIGDFLKKMTHCFEFAGLANG